MSDPKRIAKKGNLNSIPFEVTTTEFTHLLMVRSMPDALQRKTFELAAALGKVDEFHALSGNPPVPPVETEGRERRVILSVHEYTFLSMLRSLSEHSQTKIRQFISVTALSLTNPQGVARTA